MYTGLGEAGVQGVGVNVRVEGLGDAIGVSGSGTEVGIFGRGNVGVCGGTGSIVALNIAGVAGTSPNGYGGRFQGGLAPLKLEPSNTQGHPTSGNRFMANST